MLAKELKTAVDKVVEANPCLSARVVNKDNRMLLEPGVHKDIFFRVVDPPKECPLIGSLDLKGKLQFLQNLEQNFTNPGTAMNTIKSGMSSFLGGVDDLSGALCLLRDPLVALGGGCEDVVWHRESVECHLSWATNWSSWLGMSSSKQFWVASVVFKGSTKSDQLGLLWLARTATVWS